MFPIKIYVNHKGDFYLPTGIDLKVENWIGDLESPTDNKRYNTMLCQLLTRVNSMIYLLRVDGKLGSMSKNELKAHLKDEKEDESSKTYADAM